MTRDNPALTLDPRWPCLSPESADPHSVPLAAQEAELSRELDQRRHAYPRRVEKRMLSQYDADRRIDLLHAIHDDIAWLAQFARWSAGTEPRFSHDMTRHRDAAEAAIARFRWSELVAELRREIDMRRKYYPAWVRKGSLDAPRARLQLERIEAVHFLYWVHGRWFMPDELHSVRDRVWTVDGPERALFRAAAHAHRARFAAASRRGDYVDIAPTAATEPELALA